MSNGKGSKQKRWRCVTCGHKTRAPGQAGRAWCRFCEEYEGPVKMTRQEWRRSKGLDYDNNTHDNRANSGRGSETQPSFVNREPSYLGGTRDRSGPGSDIYDPFGYGKA